MKRYIIRYLMLLAGMVLGTCGTMPVDGTTGQGRIDVRVWIHKPLTLAKTAVVHETTWDKLVVQVAAGDMDTLRDTLALDMERPYAELGISDVPAGDDRTVTAWTIDAEGDTIHGASSAAVNVEPTQTASVSLELYPLRGSIYITLTDFPASVDSIVVLFESSSDTWSVRVAREAKLYTSLDKIPFGTQGTLSIVGLDATGDTITSWTYQDLLFTDDYTTIEASFITIGAMELSVTVHRPGITLVNGLMDTTVSLGDEAGGLIITEIMYAANDSEYIEIHNLQGSLFDDTLILQKDNGTFYYFDVAIAPGGFFVIGRDQNDSLAWVDTCPPSASVLDLSSTSGNWITLRAKDSIILDYVAFDVGTNVQEWPRVSGKKSIVLDSLAADPEYNNFGRHWYVAETAIDTSEVPVTGQYGTPGAAGL